MERKKAIASQPSISVLPQACQRDQPRVGEATRQGWVEENTGQLPGREIMWVNSTLNIFLWGHFLSVKQVVLLVSKSIACHPVRGDVTEALCFSVEDSPFLEVRLSTAEFTFSPTLESAPFMLVPLVLK